VNNLVIFSRGVEFFTGCAHFHFGTGFRGEAGEDVGEVRDVHSRTGSSVCLRNLSTESIKQGLSINPTRELTRVQQFLDGGEGFLAKGTRKVLVDFLEAVVGGYFWLGELKDTSSSAPRKLVADRTAGFIFQESSLNREQRVLHLVSAVRDWALRTQFGDCRHVASYR